MRRDLPITSQSLVSRSVSLRICCMGTSGSKLTGFCGDRMPASASACVWEGSLASPCLTTHTRMETPSAGEGRSKAERWGEERRTSKQKHNYVHIKPNLGPTPFLEPHSITSRAPGIVLNQSLGKKGSRTILLTVLLWILRKYSVLQVSFYTSDFDYSGPVQS